MSEQERERLDRLTREVQRLRDVDTQNVKLREQNARLEAQLHAARMPATDQQGVIPTGWLPKELIRLVDGGFYYARNIRFDAGERKTGELWYVHFNPGELDTYRLRLCDTFGEVLEAVDAYERTRKTATAEVTSDAKGSPSP